MSPASTRSWPGIGSPPALSHCTTGLSGVIASSPGSSFGSLRRCATSFRKFTSSGTTGTPASSSPHFSTDR